MVGGPQSLQVKLAAGIFHAGSGQGVDLQFAVMGGCHGADASPMQMVQYGDGKSGALGRVGSCPQFVKQNQGALIHLL